MYKHQRDLRKQVKETEIWMNRAWLFICLVYSSRGISATGWGRVWPTLIIYHFLSHDIALEGRQHHTICMDCLTVSPTVLKLWPTDIEGSLTRFQGHWRGQEHFYKHTKMLFALFIMLIFAQMVQKWLAFQHKSKHVLSQKGGREVGGVHKFT